MNHINICLFLSAFCLKIQNALSPGWQPFAYIFNCTSPSALCLQYNIRHHVTCYHILQNMIFGLVWSIQQGTHVGTQIVPTCWHGTTTTPRHLSGLQSTPAWSVLMMDINVLEFTICMHRGLMTPVALQGTTMSANKYKLKKWELTSTCFLSDLTW